MCPAVITMSSTRPSTTSRPDLPTAEVLGRESSHQLRALGGEIWTQPIAGEQTRTLDHDAAGVGQLNMNPGQRYSVVDAAAAGLAHAVAGHDADAAGRRPIEQFAVSGSSTDQNRAEASQRLGSARRAATPAPVVPGPTRCSAVLTARCRGRAGRSDRNAAGRTRVPPRHARAITMRPAM